ncbi:hypothetical protein PHMEG_00010950 [Phytophthora megakarya]|uniref:Uncharacterized protein n=1 Tax=Phytophthora megakarya TaxID=4795 RepID=A0A225WCF3_9STRA|nr:hypothetical protein PHMEG_00010950 [Phytophthora megakarya]
MFKNNEPKRPHVCQHQARATVVKAFERSLASESTNMEHLSIGAGEVFFIRFIRVKISDEVALSLFPDGVPTTCPLLALALALITQESQCATLLNFLPVKSKDVPGELTKSIPLLDLLGDSSTLGPSQVSSTNCSTSAKPVAGIHALVYHLLDRVAGPVVGEDALASHSFRRGGAQNANASSVLTAQWIFDRGAWNLTTTSKAFTYVFNTPKEDHQVAKVLSGMSPQQAVVLPSLYIFDSVTQEQIREVGCKLFNASHGLANKTFNLNSAVVDVVTATIIHHYPSLMKFNTDAPAVKTIQRCTEVSGVTMTCLLAWSQQLARSTAHTKPIADDIMGGNAKAKVVFDHQSDLIERLIEVNRNLEARVNLLGSTNTYAAGKTSAREDQEKRPRDKDENVPVKRRRRSKTTPLVDTWFAWYTAVPRGWPCTNKHKTSDSKRIVAFMRLFIDDGYVLEDSSPNYKENVRQLGELASQETIAFQSAQGIPSKGSNVVLKALRQLHREGILNDRIFAYQQRLAVNRIVDPASSHFQRALIVRS